MRRAVAVVFLLMFLGSAGFAETCKVQVHFPNKVLIDQGFEVIKFNSGDLIGTSRIEYCRTDYAACIDKLPLAMSAYGYNNDTDKECKMRLDATSNDNDVDFTIGTLTDPSEWKQDFRIAYPGDCYGDNDVLRLDRKCYYDSADNYIYTSCKNFIEDSDDAIAYCFVLGGEEECSSSRCDYNTDANIGDYGYDVTSSSPETYVMRLDYSNNDKGSVISSHYNIDSKQVGWGFRTCSNSNDCSNFGTTGPDDSSSYCIGGGYLSIYPAAGEPIKLGDGLCSDFLFIDTSSDFSHYVSEKDVWYNESNELKTKEGFGLNYSWSELDTQNLTISEFPSLKLDYDDIKYYEGAQCDIKTGTVYLDNDDNYWICEGNVLKVYNAKDYCEDKQNGTWLGQEPLFIFDNNKNISLEGQCVGENSKIDYVECVAEEGDKGGLLICTSGDGYSCKESTDDTEECYDRTLGGKVEIDSNLFLCTEAGWVALPELQISLDGSCKSEGGEGECGIDVGAVSFKKGYGVTGGYTLKCSGAIYEDPTSKIPSFSFSSKDNLAVGDRVTEYVLKDLLHNKKDVGVSCRLEGPMNGQDSTLYVFADSDIDFQPGSRLQDRKKISDEGAPCKIDGDDDSSMCISFCMESTSECLHPDLTDDESTWETYLLNDYDRASFCAQRKGVWITASKDGEYLNHIEPSKILYGEELNAGDSYCLGNEDKENIICTETYTGQIYKNIWQCVASGSNYFWIPYFNDSNLKLLELNFGETGKFRLSYKVNISDFMPDSQMRYYVRDVNCKLSVNDEDVSSNSLSGTKKQSADGIAGILTIDGIRMEDVATYSGGKDARINAKCSAKVNMYDKNNAPGDNDLVLYEITGLKNETTYNDTFVACSKSSECIHFCNISYSRLGNTFTVDSDSSGYIGKCGGASLGQRCELGNYFPSRVFSNDWLDYGYSIICDEFIYDPQHPTKSNCMYDAASKDCFYTCYSDRENLQVFYGDSQFSATSFSFYNPYAHDSSEEYFMGCDYAYEDYSTCRDCCEKPAGGGVCGPEDYYEKFTADDNYNNPDVKCGVANGNNICWESCGASSGCDGKISGGRECTRWCNLKTDLSGNFDIRFYPAGSEHSESNEVPSLETCKTYDMCIMIPFNPNCGTESNGPGCKVTFVSGHDIMVGSNRLGEGESFLVYSGDYNISTDDQNQRIYWKVCSSNSTPLRFLPSAQEIGKDDGIPTTTTFSMDFDLLDNEKMRISDYPQVTFNINIANPHKCDFGAPCLFGPQDGNYFNGDCQNYEPDSPPDAEPFCSKNNICVDPDLEGAFFGVVVTNDWTDLSGETIWSSCQPSDCSFTTQACDGYFMGLETRSDTVSMLLTINSWPNTPDDVAAFKGFTGFWFSLGGGEESKYYEFSDTLAGEGKSAVEVVNDYGFRSAFLIPATHLAAGSYAFVNLSNGTIGIPTLVGLTTQGAVSCDTKVNEGQTPPPSISSGGICFLDSDCMYFGNPTSPTDSSPGHVSICKDIPSSTQVDHYDSRLSSYYYSFGKVCTNTCGDGFCRKYNSKESPENCRDCCSVYGTGALDTEWRTTIFESCYYDDEKAQVEGCDGATIGSIDGLDAYKWDGKYICSLLDNGKFGKTQRRTPISHMKFEGAINSTTIFESPEDIVYDVWMNYSDRANIIFTLEDDASHDIWEHLDDLNIDDELASSIFQNLKVMRIRNWNATGIDAVEPKLGSETNNKITYTFNPDSSYETQHIYLSVKQNNLLPTNVTFRVHVVYDTELELSLAPGQDKDCFYRGSEKGGEHPICNTQPIKLKAVHTAPGEIAYKFPDTRIECSLDEFSTEDTLIGLGDRGDRAEKGDIELFVGELPPGKYTLTCRATGQNLKPAEASLDITVYGRISSASAVVPVEAVPGRDYELPLTAVYDEYQKSMRMYSYSWSIDQNGLLLPLVRDRPKVTIPPSFGSSQTDLVLSIRRSYYHNLTKFYPIHIVAPNQISASTAPSIVYVPPAGKDNLSVLFLVRNDGPSVNLELDYADHPDWIKVHYLVTQRTFWGWDITEIPIWLEIAPAPNPDAFEKREGTVTIKLFNEEEEFSQVSIRVVQTKEPYYEFNVQADEPCDSNDLTISCLDLIDNKVTGGITIQNVGTEDDSYVIDSDLPVSASDVALPFGDTASVKVTAGKEGEYELCVRSARLFISKEPKCVTIRVVKKEITPALGASDQIIEATPGRTMSFALNITTANYSGKYRFEFEGDLSILDLEESFEEGKTTNIHVPFSTNASGKFNIIAKAYPAEYPHKYGTAEFTLSVSFPAPMTATLLMNEIEERMGRVPSDKSTLLLQKVDAARQLIADGRYDEANFIMNNVIDELAKLEKIETYRQQASYTKPFRQNTFLVIGVLLAFAGLFLYFR